MAEDPARKGGQASTRSEKVSAAQIQVYLKGIDYPVNKQQLVDHARSNNAPENVMSFITRFPERTYTRPNEVQEEFGKLK
ncbi:MAG: DUF2795 domain-containing protein [Dehalococcoidia bacterium]|nr:DUF2795 domain-containing protein [Dehalococcoidia bacterium]